MGTSVAEATPTGSLAEAAAAFGRIRSQDSGDRTAPTTQPEQREDDTARPDATQAPANVQATSPDKEQTEEAPATTSRTFKVKADGEEIEVTEEELLKGYSRQAAFDQRMSKLDLERKELQSVKAKWESEEVSAVRAQRQEYAELLGKMKAVVTPVEPDPTTLSPEEFHVRYAEYKSAKEAVEKIEAEQKRVKDLEAAEAEEGFKKHVHGEYQKLVEAIPEFGDTEKAEPLRKELGQFAVSLGFTEQELAHVTDHRLVKLLHKAMQADKAAKKAPEIKNKIERVLETLPPGGRQDASPRNDVAKALERLSTTHSVEAAAAAFSAIRKRDAAPR